MADDSSGLNRFVRAQEADYEQALSELRSGRKRTHWMWYVFPQLRGLGSSWNAVHYGISGIAEAEAYLAHPVLGPRLIACAKAVLEHQDLTASAIFGSPDDVKLRSSATLFARVSPPGSVFHRILDAFYNGEPDDATLRRLPPQSPG